MGVMDASTVEVLFVTSARFAPLLFQLPLGSSIEENVRRKHALRVKGCATCSPAGTQQKNTKMTDNDGVFK
jgi:hypothetical protein